MAGEGASGPEGGSLGLRAGAGAVDTLRGQNIRILSGFTERETSRQRSLVWLETVKSHKGSSFPGTSLRPEGGSLGPGTGAATCEALAGPHPRV